MCERESCQLSLRAIPVKNLMEGGSRSLKIWGNYKLNTMPTKRSSTPPLLSFLNGIALSLLVFQDAIRILTNVVCTRLFFDNP